MTGPRIPTTAGIGELGLSNWAFCRLAARRLRQREMHLFTTLGVHRRLLKVWLPFSGYLLYAGRLSRADAETVILRVGHLRNCEYELQQHRRLARSRGLDAAQQARIFEGPGAEGLTVREQALLTATDEFVLTRTVSEPVWAALAAWLDRRQLIEFCLLAAQYDGLAATITTLRIPLDYPD